jgi:hypothetical protein
MCRHENYGVIIQIMAWSWKTVIKVGICRSRQDLDKKQHVRTCRLFSKRNKNTGLDIWNGSRPNLEVSKIWLFKHLQEKVNYGSNPFTHLFKPFKCLLVVFLNVIQEDSEHNRIGMKIHAKLFIICRAFVCTSNFFLTVCCQSYSQIPDKTICN